MATITGYTKTQADSLLAAKAALTSPALTGTPTAPTASVGTSSTQIATTAFVASSVAAGGGSGGGTGSPAAGGYTVNVKDYGATGQESQDATQAIKNAIAAVVTLGGAGIVYFPRGIYVINQGITVPKNIYLHGEHMYTSQLRLYTQLNDTPMLTFGADGTINVGGGIQNMNIDAETNSQVAVRMYGPQESAYLRRCLISNATIRTVEIRGLNIEGSSNKFKIEDCWIWVSGDTGMCGVWYNGPMGPLAIRDTTIVGINRSNTYNNGNGNNGGGPAGSAGIIVADGGSILMDAVNVEHFESHTNAKSTNLDMRMPSSFFCTNGVTVATNNSPTIITNAVFDNLKGYAFKNTVSGKISPFFINYRDEAYQFDRRSQDDNQWTYGKRGWTNNANEVEIGYVVDGNSDATRFKIQAINNSGGGWVEAANIDGSNTFGTGSAAYNGQHFRMGTFRLWVDGSGRLRIKNGAPTSDTDGSIVGAQS